MVTGANGFIGRYLTAQLADQGADMSIITRQSIGLSFNVHQYIGDIRDEMFINNCLEDSSPEYIFHLAAAKARLSDSQSFYQAIDNNLLGSLNLLNAAKKLTTLQAIVTAGTAEEYGQNEVPFIEDTRESPVSAYSFSKTCVTHLCETFYAIHKLPCIVIRPALAYGPGQDSDMFLPALINSLIKGQQFPMTLGHQTRDYIYISDLVNAFILAALNGDTRGQIYNIGSGKPVRLTELALLVEKMLGKDSLVQLGKLNYRPAEIMNYVVDSSKAKEHLGWIPKVDLEEGLKRTIAFYQGELS